MVATLKPDNMSGQLPGGIALQPVFRHTLFVFLLTTLLGSVPSLSAQESAGATSPEAVPKIGVFDISPQIQETVVAMRQARERMAPDPAIETLQENSDQRRRQKLPVKVAFGSDPRKVEEILITVAEEHEATLKDPAPMALFDGTTETGMNFNLLWWVPFDVGLGARNQVAIATHEALRDAGIEAPIPVRRVSNPSAESG